MRILALPLLMSACAPAFLSHDASTPPDDMATSPIPSDLASFAAPHAPLPQVTSQGGPVIAAPQIVTISFPGFAFDSQIVPFADWLVTSDYFTSVGSEYGVGAGMHKHIVVSDTPPATTSNAYFGQLVDSLAQAGMVPPVSPNVAYLFLLPPGTVAGGISLLPCRSDYAPAYHSDDGAGVIFGAVYTCSAVTEAAVERYLAHEIIESSTDPFWKTKPAYQLPTSNAYSVIGGGELVDMCNMPITVDGHTVPRVWSNAQAQKGADPCVPAQADTFYDTTGAMTTATVTVGGSTTVPLAGWSLAETDDWNVEADAVTSPNSAFLAIPSIDHDSINNGGTIQLTVQAPSGATTGDVLPVVVYSFRQADLATFISWPLVVTVQ